MPTPATVVSVEQGWKPRRILPGIGRDLSRAWWRLALTDLSAKALTFAILTPAVALLLRWFLQRAGSAGVISDEAILFFFLSPLGLITLLVVGSVTGAIYFAEIAATLMIAVGAQSGLRVGLAGALRFVAGRVYALVWLALQALMRLMLVATPFVAATGGVYALLLTRYDIYYYLTVKPPEYWIAAVLVGAILTVGAFLVVRWLLRWSFAIPILLFEELAPAAALRESVARTSSRLLAIAAWHGAWLAGEFVLSGLSTAAVGLAGRALIPPDGSLGVVATGVGAVALTSFLLNLSTLVLSSALYAVMLGRLYAAVRPDSATDAQGRLEAYAGSATRLSGKVGWALVIAMAVGVATLAGIAVNRARTAHTAQVTAHRGAKHDAPENTLAAVEVALEQGTDWVEIDVQLTADDHVIVVHDRDFNRVSGSNLRAETSALADLRSLDVGGWFGPEFRGQRPPTLEEVLELCRGRAGVNIELKYFGPDRGLAERVIGIVEELAMADQILLMSFQHDRIAEAKRLRPEWTMGLLVAVALGDVLRLEADFYAVPTSLATRGFIQAAHRRGREVHVWTVDDPLRMSAMVSRGVDNLITGFPVVAQSVLEERAAMGPVERLLIDLAADFGIVRLRPEAPASEEDA